MIGTLFTENDELLNDTTMDISGSQINSSRFHCSQSSLSTEGDISFSSAIDRELDSLILGDELPVFEIRLVSPLGRTPSPIDTDPEDFRTPLRRPKLDGDSIPSECLSSEFVTLQEINSLINPPADDEETKAVSRCNSLETIFEGVFLNTPPKKPSNVRINSMRGNLFEKIIVKRMCSGKENKLVIHGTVYESSKPK